MKHIKNSREILSEVKNTEKDLTGRITKETVSDKSKVIVKAGQKITAEMAKKIAKLKIDTVKVRPYISKKISYLFSTFFCFSDYMRPSMLHSNAPKSIRPGTNTLREAM